MVSNVLTFLVLTMVVFPLQAGGISKKHLEKVGKIIITVPTSIPGKVAEKAGKELGGDVGHVLQKGGEAAVKVSDKAGEVVYQEAGELLQSKETQAVIVNLPAFVAVTAPPVLETEPPETDDVDAEADKEADGAGDDNEDGDAEWDFWEEMTDEAWDRLVGAIFGTAAASFLSASAPAELGSGDDKPIGYRFPPCTNCSEADAPNTSDPKVDPYQVPRMP